VEVQDSEQSSDMPPQMPWHAPSQPAGKNAMQSNGKGQERSTGIKGNLQLGPYSICGSEGIVPGYGSTTIQLTFEPVASEEREVDLKITLLPLHDTSTIEPIFVHLQVCSLSWGLEGLLGCRNSDSTVHTCCTFRKQS
jgi:hypothetical protein